MLDALVLCIPCIGELSGVELHAGVCGLCNGVRAPASGESHRLHQVRAGVQFASPECSSRDAAGEFVGAPADPCGIRKSDQPTACAITQDNDIRSLNCLRAITYAPLPFSCMRIVLPHLPMDGHGRRTGMHSLVCGW